MAYGGHSQLPVLLIVRQNVPDLRHGLLHLPVGVDLAEETPQLRFNGARIREQKMSYLNCGNVLKGSDEILLIHSSCTRSVPPCRTESLVKHGLHVDTWGRTGSGSDLQTCCWRPRTAVGTSPCSPPSSQTQRLLWTRNVRRPPTHRPQRFYLEDKQQGLF